LLPISGNTNSHRKLLWNVRTCLPRYTPSKRFHWSLETHFPNYCRHATYLNLNIQWHEKPKPLFHYMNQPSPVSILSLQLFKFQFNNPFICDVLQSRVSSCVLLQYSCGHPKDRPVLHQANVSDISIRH
jgi:hypothetical protein